MTANLAASIHARLLNRAKARGEDFNQVLSRYATERFLYRLSALPAREELWLMPEKLPVGLSDQFSEDVAKHAK